MRERRDARTRCSLGRWLVAVASVAVLLAMVPGEGDAANGFASPAFGTQWQAGEALAPNFWGPLPLARDGQQEGYAEAPGGQRLVQYFDKARMELTTPDSGIVTNGLLATELITGRLQLGDATFDNRAPASIPVAGDTDNIGPTYAMIQGATPVRGDAAAQIGTPATLALTPAGTVGSFAGGSNFPQATVSEFDSTTRHNVPQAFAQYRGRVGLAAIGLAISEPFWSNVKVAGAQKDVLIQAFERRVLTFTPSNPEAFQVEFGNIGQHYYQWRYSGGAASPTIAATAATPIPTPTAPVVPIVVTATPTATTTAAPTAAPTATTTPTTTPTTTTGNGPTISGITLTAKDSAHATIQFQLSKAGTAKVMYGTGQILDTTVDATPTAGNMFSVQMTVKRADTTRYFITASDTAGNMTTRDGDFILIQDITVNVRLQAKTATTGGCTKDWELSEKVTYTYAGKAMAQTKSFVRLGAASTASAPVINLGGLANGSLTVDIQGTYKGAGCFPPTSGSLTGATFTYNMGGVLPSDYVTVVKTPDYDATITIGISGQPMILQ